MPISNPNLSDRPNDLSPVSASQLLSFPSSGGPHTMLMTFKQYQYEFARAGEQSLLNFNVSGALSGSEVRRRSAVREGRGARFNGQLTGIELPIPANLRDNDLMRIENITQSPIESAVGGYIAGAANAMQGSNLTLRDVPAALRDVGADLANVSAGDVFNQGVGALGNAVNAILNESVGNASRDVMYLLRSALPNGISQVTDRALGSTVNPRASLAFEGVELKQHSFNWTLIPKNERDSEIIRAIIRTLKQNSLPTYQTFAGTNFKAYLRYPSIVDIYLLGVNSDYFMKFKSSMIRSVNVEYGSTGIVSIVKGGKPGNVTLNIELVELDIHTAEDYGGTSGVVPPTIGDLTRDPNGPGAGR